MTENERIFVLLMFLHSHDCYDEYNRALEDASFDEGKLPKRWSVASSFVFTCTKEGWFYWFEKYLDFQEFTNHKAPDSLNFLPVISLIISFSSNFLFIFMNYFSFPKHIKYGIHFNLVGTPNSFHYL